MKNRWIALWLFAGVLLTSAVAQDTKVVNVWPGIAPGSEQWKQQETTVGPAGNQRIMNVSSPTLTAYLPDPSTATGTAVIIAPGGGFVWLSIDSEGHDVAKWLAARGTPRSASRSRIAAISSSRSRTARVKRPSCGAWCWIFWRPAK